MTELAAWSNSSHETYLSDEARLNASYQQILDKQTSYGVNLANNIPFSFWAVANHDEEGEAGPTQIQGDATAKTLQYLEMVKFYGKPYDSSVTAQNITDTGRMAEAIYALFWYRQSLSLE